MQLMIQALELSLAELEQRERVRNVEIATSGQPADWYGDGCADGLRRCHRDEAFADLAATSQALNRKIADLAEEVIFTGAMPDGASTARAG